MERMNLFQDNNKPQIIFYFAECMEFPDYGEYKEFPTLDQAISFFKKYSGTILNAVKCVGFILHDDSIYDDVKQPLMTSKHVLKDDINYISHYANTTLVQEAIKEAECYLRSKENSKSKVTTGMFDNCDLLPAEMRENFKFTDEEIHYLSGVGSMLKDPKLVNFEIMEGPMPPAPIQNEDRFLSFRVEGKEYSLRIISKEEMQRVKEEVNKNSKYTYDWFKEETGDHHWVLYNTDMYEISNDGGDRYLHYIELSGLLPTVPINATSCHLIFDNCCNMEELDLKHFNTENIITMKGMFSECSKISKLDLSCFNTAKVTNMLGMFSECYNLEELDFNSFSTVNVTIMDYMFADSLYFEHLDLSSFNTANLRTMNYMFKGCTNLLSVKLDSFDTSNVDLMEGVFEHCTEIRELDLSSFSATHAINVGKMFAYCTNLREVNLSRFNPRYAIDATGMFFRCENLMEIYAYDFIMPRLLFGRTGFFFGCVSLPSFSPDHTDIEMAKPVEDGGYFTTPSDLQLSNTSQINNILSQENTGMKGLNQLLKMITL